MSYGNFCGCCGQPPDPYIRFVYSSAYYSCESIDCSFFRVTDPNDPCGFEIFNKVIGTYSNGITVTRTSTKKPSFTDGCTGVCEDRYICSGTRTETYTATGLASGSVTITKNFSGNNASIVLGDERIDTPDSFGTCGFFSSTLPSATTTSDCSGSISISYEDCSKTYTYSWTNGGCRATYDGSTFGIVVPDCNQPPFSAGIDGPEISPTPTTSIERTFDQSLDPYGCITCEVPPLGPPAFPDSCDPDPNAGLEGTGTFVGESTTPSAFNFDDPATGSQNYTFTNIAVRHPPTPTCYLKVWIYIETTEYEMGITECGEPDGILTPKNPTYSQLGEYTWDESQSQSKKCYENSNDPQNDPINGCQNAITSSESWNLDPPIRTSYTVKMKYSFVKNYEPDDPWVTPRCKPDGYPDPNFESCQNN